METTCSPCISNILPLPWPFLVFNVDNKSLDAKVPQISKFYCQMYGVPFFALSVLSAAIKSKKHVQHKVLFWLNL